MFSVVIPTHDRLDLLRDAVDTVLRQDFSDWELVIFDNASTNGLAEYVKRTRDPRIRYERSDDFLPVSDSWNRAIDLATEDYVTMLGDDDGLTPGYFTKLKQVITDFNSPDVLYSNIYQFFQPGVAPWSPQGYVADLKYGFFFEGKEMPFLLSSREALTAVRGSVDLRRNFTFNMQAFCFHRSFLVRLRGDGPIFRSPFPDYYLANVAFAKAHTVVVIPEPISIAGVTKKSFGYMLFNGFEEKGAELLNTDLNTDPIFREVEKFLLPGPSYDTNYAITMEHVVRYVRDFLGHGVAIGRYRRLQIFRMLNANAGSRALGTPAGRLLWSRLSFVEKLWMLGLSAIIKVSIRLGCYETMILSGLNRFLELYDYVAPVKIVSQGQYSRLIDFFVALQPTNSTPAASGQPLLVRSKAAPGEPATNGSGSLTPQNGRIAVVYLARMAEGIGSLRRFADSYVHNAAGIEHDLVVIYKGYDRIDEINAAKTVFAEIPHIGIEISDKGFDINAYFEAARRLDHDYICFLNTFAEIAVSGWLSHLYRYAVSPFVGIVGAMGSYESLYDSYALIHKVMSFYNGLKVYYNEKLAHYYDFIIDNHWSALKENEQRFMVRLYQKICSLYSFYILIYKFGVYLAHRDWRELVRKIRVKLVQWMWVWEAKKQVNSAYQEKSIDENFRLWWEYQVSPKGSMTVYSKFAPFPNPHIRSNGFMISRKRFLELRGVDIKTKFDANVFESGVDSMTNQIRRQGLKAVVVGRSGLGYDVADWARSGTFRLGDQENLILTDNQSRNFSSMTPGAKATYARMTWGDYLEPTPPDFPDLGFKFAIGPGVTNAPNLYHPHRVKFSFLIPSKNRLELLKYAIDSILRQQYQDFEIIISDNASEQDYAGFVDKIDDSRIIYQRLNEPVSVTENWRRALARASGDYVLMLGDDDALTPWFLPRISDAINTKGYPEIVYFPAYHYCYPNVIPSESAGYLIDVRNSVFFKGRKEPFFLSSGEAQSVAKACFDFRSLFGFNSQHYLFKADFLQTLSGLGGVFQSPYPDTFAAIVTFLKAKSILVVPYPMSIIGISPKSFGYYYFNDLQTEGYEFLDNDQVSPAIQESLKDIMLPGDKNNTHWMVAAEQAREALAPEFTLTVNYARYRTLQMVAFLRSIYLKRIRPASEIDHFVSSLTMTEQVAFTSMHKAIEAAKVRGYEHITVFFESIDREINQFTPAQLMRVDIGKHSNIGDAFNWLTRTYCDGHLGKGPKNARPASAQSADR
jgi:glycosyltransferase involved in cell wall biosynthesis